MSCRDWPRLLAHRLDPTLEEPADWPDHEAHLAACDACRRAALALDPTLAFRAVAVWRPEPGEPAAIRQAVRTLRRASSLEAEAAGTGPRRSRAPWVAAGLFALILVLHPTGTVRGPEGPFAPPAAGRLRVAGPAAPAIEGVDRPHARVYEWGAEDLSVVMVIDESLDV